MASLAWTQDELIEPPQYQQPQLYDFRAAEEGPRGFKVGVTKRGRPGSKRKLDEYAEQVEREQAEMQEEDAAAAAAAIGPIIKRPKRDTIGVGTVSGRSWKLPGVRAGTLKGAAVSTSWEKKMAIKAQEKEYSERKKAAEAARKEKAAEERKRRAAVKAAKEAKKEASAIVQRVSTATAKRMLKSKKQRKKLKTAE